MHAWPMKKRQAPVLWTCCALSSLPPCWSSWRFATVWCPFFLVVFHVTANAWNSFDPDFDIWKIRMDQAWRCLRLSCFCLLIPQRIASTTARDLFETSHYMIHHLWNERIVLEISGRRWASIQLVLLGSSVWQTWSALRSVSDEH